MENKLICPHCKKEIPIDDLVKANIKNLQKNIDSNLQRELEKKAQEVQKQQKILIEKQENYEKQAKLEHENLEKKYKEDLQERLIEEKKALSEQLIEQQNITMKHVKDLYENTMKEKEKALEENKRKVEQLKIQAEETKKSLKNELSGAIGKEYEAQINALVRQKDRLEDALKKNKNDEISQEMKGELGENEIKRQIQEKFGPDSVKDVEKGALGADLVFEVVDRGQLYGTIIIEVKNTKNWSNEWIEKLKKDQIRSGSDRALLISRAKPPKETKEVYLNEWSSSVYSCSPIGFLANLTLFRKSMIEMASLRALDSDKGTIKDLLYERVTSPAFKNRLEYINNHFMKMKEEIEKHETDSKRHFNKQKVRIEEMITHVYGIQDYVEVIVGSDTEKIATDKEIGKGEK